VGGSRPLWYMSGLCTFVVVLMPGAIPNPTRIIHMTHTANLAAIAGGGCLRCTAQLRVMGAGFTNIAYTSIQVQRAAKVVPCGPGGRLHDYVPFYFTTRSPMLYTINRGNVPCDGGQSALLHLVTTAQAVEQAGLGFAFTDGHGIMSYTQFFDDLARLDEIDWPLIGSRYWSDTSEDGDRKRRKQAEFLVHQQLPWELVMGITVQTDGKRLEVEGLLAGAAHRPPVIVNPSWYY
jgi:ssDNA thymidine ADP-ribosyltransferase, DarT